MSEGDVRMGQCERANKCLKQQGHCWQSVTWSDMKWICWNNEEEPVTNSKGKMHKSPTDNDITWGCGRTGEGNTDVVSQGWAQECKGICYERGTLH